MDNILSISVESDNPAHRSSVDRVNELLKNKSAIPTFSQAAVKLCALAQKEDASIDEFTHVVSLDPGLAARCLYVASSIGFAARPIENIQQALMLVGVRQIRRIAFTVAVIGAFSGFSARIDWKKFWFHNVLVARLTEDIAKRYREVTGMEYLAGLLHDIGKVIVEHYFPKEFEHVIVGAIEKQCNHAQMEKSILGVDHAQIGAAMCQSMQIHPHIQRAVRFHHEPMSPAHASDPDGDLGFLATCVCAADQVANKVIMRRKEPIQPVSLAEFAPKGSFMHQQQNALSLPLDVQKEVAKTEGDLAGLL